MRREIEELLQCIDSLLASRQLLSDPNDLFSLASAQDTLDVQIRDMVGQYEAHFGPW